MLNKYKIGDQEFLCYSDKEISFPKELNVQLIEENAKLEENQHIPLHNHTELAILGINPGLRLPEKILFEEGIITFNDLKNAYFLIKTKELKKSKKVRDLILQKYETISTYFGLS